MYRYIIWNVFWCNVISYSSHSCTIWLYVVTHSVLCESLCNMIVPLGTSLLCNELMSSLSRSHPVTKQRCLISILTLSLFSLQCIPCILDKNKTTTEKEYHRTKESEACLKHISSRVELYHKTCNEEECVYRTELTMKERKYEAVRRNHGYGHDSINGQLKTNWATIL